MGIYTDLASGDQIPSKPRVGLDRSAGEQLLAKSANIGPTVKTAYAAQDEVTRIAAHTGTPVSGNYTITVEFPTLGITYTTASIAYNATAATIETALDTASPAAVPNGDVVVSEEGAAGLSDGYCDFTCEDAVAEIPCLISIADVDMSGGSPGAVTRTTPGQSDRKAAMALFELNVISGSLWNSGEQPSLTKPASSGQSRPRFQLIHDLAVEAAVEDGKNYIYDAVMALYPRQ